MIDRRAGLRIGLEARNIQDVTGNPGWIVLGWVGFALLPWYGFDRSAAPTPADYFVSGSASFTVSWSLVASADPRCRSAWPCGRSSARRRLAGTLARRAGLLGLALIVLQGFTIGLNGWTLDILKACSASRDRARPAWATARR